MLQVLPEEWSPGYHMVDACSDADPILPDAFKPFQSRMKAFYGATSVACALAVACAPAATPPEVPQPAPASAPPAAPLEGPHGAAVPPPPPFHMDSTLTADEVPPFKESPLIVWGPLPD